MSSFVLLVLLVVAVVIACSVALVAVANFRAGLFVGGRLMALQDQITKIQADLDTLVATVTEVVAEIATLKASGVTAEQSAAIDAITTKLETATADLKAGE